MTASGLARAAVLAAAGGLSLAAAGCVSVDPGQGAALVGPRGGYQVLGEGASLVAPLSYVSLYDLREQERNEDLVALTADGAPVEAGSSLVSFHVPPGELAALHREVGPDYYRVLVRPELFSAVRRVLARYTWTELIDPDQVLAAQREITAQAAARLKPRHVALDAVVIRGVFMTLPETAAQIADTSVWEQKAQQAREDVSLARGRADALRARARGTALSADRVAPTLSPFVLDDEERRAWERLLLSPSTVTEVVADGSSSIVEVEP